MKSDRNAVHARNKFLQESQVMDIAIETGTPTDLPAINTIYNHYINNSHATFETNEWDEKRRSDWFEQFTVSLDKYFLFVARLDDEVVAFAYNAPFREKPAYSSSSEVTIYTKPGLQSIGIGKKLYQALLNQIAGTNLHRLYALLAMPNTGSVRLHEKFGFHCIGTMDNVGFKHGQYHSVAIFEKQLGVDDTQDIACNT